MKWNKKYNYPKSSRSILNGSRHYNVDNQILPSVTSILSLTRSDSEKASLAAWADRVGKSESLRIKNSAAARGTEMHKKFEDFLGFANKFWKKYSLNAEEQKNFY